MKNLHLEKKPKVNTLIAEWATVHLLDAKIMSSLGMKYAGISPVCGTYLVLFKNFSLLLLLLICTIRPSNSQSPSLYKGDFWQC